MSSGTGQARFFAGLNFFQKVFGSDLAWATRAMAWLRVQRRCARRSSRWYSARAARAAYPAYLLHV